METLQKLISFIKDLPIVGKVLSIIAIVIALVIMLFFSTGCGLTRATVRNSADGTTTTISIQTNNPTSVETSPDVYLNTYPNN